MFFKNRIILTSVLFCLLGLAFIGSKEVCACGPKITVANALLEKAAITLGWSWRAPREPI